MQFQLRCWAKGRLARNRLQQALKQRKSNTATRIAEFNGLAFFQAPTLPTRSQANFTGQGSDQQQAVLNAWEEVGVRVQTAARCIAARHDQR